MAKVADYPVVVVEIAVKTVAAAIVAEAAAAVWTDL